MRNARLTLLVAAVVGLLAGTGAQAGELTGSVGVAHPVTDVSGFDADALVAFADLQFPDLLGDVSLAVDGHYLVSDGLGAFTRSKFTVEASLPLADGFEVFGLWKRYFEGYTDNFYLVGLRLNFDGKY